MKNQKGFIQIPILIAIIIGVIVVGGAGYVGVQQYQNHQTEKPRQETVAQSSQETSTPTSTPEISEIEKLRQEVENLRKQQFSPKQTQVPSSFIKQTVANTSPKLGALTNAEIINRVKPATVYIQSDDGSGSGMIIEADGFILTNAHVVKGFTNVHVTLQSNEVYPAVVIGRDENADLAVLKINGDHFPMVQFGDSNKVNQGDEVFTFGFPFGIEGDVSFKEGTVSRRIEGYFETSAEIHPGNSGGPLVNIYGQVIGVNTAIYGKSVAGLQLGETIKFAIPINTASNLIADLKAGRNIIVESQEEKQAKQEAINRTACLAESEQYYQNLVNSINQLNANDSELQSLLTQIDQQIESIRRDRDSQVSDISARYNGYISQVRQLYEKQIQSYKMIFLRSGGTPDPAQIAIYTQKMDQEIASYESQKQAQISLTQASANSQIQKYEALKSKAKSDREKSTQDSLVNAKTEKAEYYN